MFRIFRPYPFESNGYGLSYADFIREALEVGLGPPERAASLLVELRLAGYVRRCPKGGYGLVTEPEGFVGGGMTPAT